jgi:hypothetical protein
LTYNVGCQVAAEPDVRHPVLKRSVHELLQDLPHDGAQAKRAHDQGA